MTDPTPSSSTGLDQNIAGALTYLLGFISGVTFLVIEKDSRFVRFHAMQSTITFGGFFILYVVLTMTLIGGVLLVPLLLVQVVLWILLMVKAFSGQAYKLPWLGEIAEKQLQKM